MLAEFPESDATWAFLAPDRESDGYVWNVTQLWCWRPDVWQLTERAPEPWA